MKMTIDLIKIPKNYFLFFFNCKCKLPKKPLKFNCKYLKATKVKA